MFDINVNQSFSKLCNGQSRRDCLRVGTLGPLGLTMAHLLQQRSILADEAPQRRAKSVILVYLGGGLSHHDSFDMKPDEFAQYIQKETQIWGKIISDAKLKLD